MYVIVSATRLELDPVMSLVEGNYPITGILSGVGPVETAINLTEYLSRKEATPVAGVINVGIAGAYPGSGAELLDICLADREVLGDTGISFPDRIEPLDPSFAPPVEFSLDDTLLKSAEDSLNNSGTGCRRGGFVTLSAVSGTLARGKYFRDKFNAICENMEGAAVARVCRNFTLPCLELRCVSNMVIDREEQVWRTEESVNKLSVAVKIVLEGLQGG